MHVFNMIHESYTNMQVHIVLCCDAKRYCLPTSYQNLVLYQ